MNQTLDLLLLTHIGIKSMKGGIYNKQCMENSISSQLSHKRIPKFKEIPFFNGNGNFLKKEFIR
jgi:hypothetical protein